MFVTGTTLEQVFALAAAGFEHPQPASAGRGDLERALATIEAMCLENGWALGDSFTAADVVFGGFLDFSMVFGWFASKSKVASYIERIRQRSAYRETHAGFIDMKLSVSA